MKRLILILLVGIGLVQIDKLEDLKFMYKLLIFLTP